MNAAVTAAISVGGSVIVALAGFLANVRNTNKTTALTLRAVELTEQGQVTDRYTKAVEQLDSHKGLDVRIGGIYALERVARDSPRDHPTVMEVLAAFVREHSRERWPEAEPGAEPPDPETRPDVQAAMTVIGRRDCEYDDERPLNLACAELPRADLPEANFPNAALFGAVLNGTNLRSAVLDGANLRGADLRGVVLNGANLNRANLRDAKLQDAQFGHANLRDAKLQDLNFLGVYLSHADLTGANLRHSVFRGAKFHGAILTGADLTRAILGGADFTDADFTDAELTRADFAGAVLTGAVYPEDQPLPEGWVRDLGSGRLGQANKKANSAGTLGVLAPRSHSHDRRR